MKFWDHLNNYMERYASGRVNFIGALLDIICSPIGIAFLYIKYRDKNKILKAKQDLYDGSYGIAGRIILMQLLLLIPFALLIVVFYAVVRALLTTEN